MVFEALVSDLLNRFIGNYVENLDKSQLKIGIWGGNVVLENLRVKENALSEFDVPFKVKAGQIGKLTLKIPWKNLYSDAVVATLDGLYLLVVPGATIRYDAAKEENYQQENKQKELQRIDEALRTAAHREKAQEEKKDSFAEKLATQVIKNLQVKITSIHVRYEDDVSDPQKPLSAGVTLSELSLQTADENWKTCILNEAAKIFYKLGRLDCLCAYWNVHGEIYHRGSWEHIVGKLKCGIITAEEELKNFQYIFKPIFASAKMRINPTAEIELKSPKAELHLEVQNIALEMTRPQYLSVVDLLESVDCMVKNTPYRRFRPDVPLHSHARLWWQYCISSILEVHVRRQAVMWSWSHIRRHRQTLRCYRNAYKNRLTQSKTRDDTDKSIQDLEKLLDVFNITLARQQAHMEVVRSGQKLIGKKAAAQKQGGGGGGFFSSFFGRKDGGKKKEEEEEEEESTLDSIMTPEEKAKLYTAIGYSGSSHNLTLPKQYVAVILSFKLLRTSVTLREERDVPEILKVQMIDLSTVISQRPGAQAIKLEAGLQHWYVTGLQQQGVVPSLIASVGSHASTLLSVQYELNPEDSPADQLLRVQSQPVEIIYDAMTINSLAEFFKTEKGVDLELITTATLMKLEEIKEKTALGLSHIIETRKVLDLSVDLKPSYLLLPQSGFFHQEAQLLILDFGSLQLNSVDQSHQQMVSPSFSSLEEIMDRAYERYTLQLRRVQLLYSTGDSWKLARQQRTSLQHILQPMDVTLDLAKCMVDRDSRMPRFKISGELPLLSVKLSERKLLDVFQLISTIPLPASSPAHTPADKVLSVPLTDSRPRLLHLNPSVLLGGVETDSEEDTSEVCMDQDLKSSMTEDLTDLQFQFEVKEVLLQLTQENEQEKCVLALSVSQLGAKGKIRTHDLSVTSYLHRVTLDNHEITDLQGCPVHLIRSSDAHGSDLLKVEFIKADVNGPHFQTMFENTEQTLKVEFSSLDFMLHTRALLSTINYLNSALPEDFRGNREKDGRSQLDRTSRRTVAKSSRNAGVVTFKLIAVLGSFGVKVCDDQVNIADVTVQGIDASVVVHPKQTEVFARLRDIVVTDADPNTVHRKVVSIVGEEVFSFRLRLYPEATEDDNYSDMSKVDADVTLRLGCIQIVYLHKFLISLLTFVDNFQTAKEALSAATAQAAERAASSVRDFAQKSFRLLMDIRLKAPLIIVPESSRSYNALLVDLGLITVDNQFSLVPVDGAPLPAVLETMEVKLTQLKLVRTSLKSGTLHADVALLEPVNLDLQVKRNLAASWFSSLPGVEVQGVLKTMQIFLSEEDLSVLMKIMVENIGEANRNPAAVVTGSGSAEVEPVEEQVVSGTGSPAPVKDTSLAENAVNVLLHFEIKEVVMHLKKPGEGQDRVFVELQLSQLGIHTEVHQYHLSATTYLHDVSVRCMDFLDSCREPLCIVSSSAKSGAELLKVAFLKADRNAPNFSSVHQSTEQKISVTFSFLDVMLHTEALLSLMSFLSSALGTSHTPSSMEMRTQTEPRASENLPLKSTLASPVDGHVVDLNIQMQLGEFNVLLCDQTCNIANIKIEDLHASLLMQGTQTHISASLRDFSILNVDPLTLHKKAVSIMGKEVFSFSLSLTPNAAEGWGYADTSKVDGRLRLSVGCIQVVYMHKFIMALLNFLDHFQAAKAALSAATAQAAEKAASSVRDFAQKSFLLSMDIRLKAPVILVPQSSTSHNALLVDLGLITVGNQFRLQPVEKRPLPAVIEHMSVQLTQLKLSRMHLQQDSSWSLLEPVNLVLYIKRNLASSWYHNLPTVEINGDLKPMKVSLSQDDLSMMLKILTENIGEASSGSPQTHTTHTFTPESVSMTTDRAKDVNENQKLSKPEVQEPLEPLETIKFRFNIESLGLVLVNQPQQQVEVCVEERRLGEFTLHQITAAGRMLGSGSMEICTALTTCTLHDHRRGVQRVTSRMLGRRDEESSDVMVDLKYVQNEEERSAVVVLQKLYLCASVEFLMAVADFFIQAMPEAPPSDTNQLQLKQTPGPRGPTPPRPALAPRTLVRAVVMDPEVVFVANQMRADAPALVASFQCDCSLVSEGSDTRLRANVRELRLLACPFIRSRDDSTFTTVLRPCSVLLETKAGADRPLTGSLNVDEIIIKISPVILNTVLTITAAMMVKPSEAAREEAGSDVGTLWRVMPVSSCNYWFLGVEPAQEVTESFREAGGRDPGESFTVQMKVVQVTLESGVGHRTAPLLLAESTINARAENWTSLLQMSAELSLEVNYFNETHAVWEPLIERVDDGKRRWTLRLEMKTNPQREKTLVPGDEVTTLPEARTVLSVISRDTLNVTLSKCCLNVFTHLTKVFSDGVAATSDCCLKERAPFTVLNALGLPLIVQHGSSLRVVTTPTSKVHELGLEESIDLEFSAYEPSARGRLSALQRQESCLFNLSVVPAGYSEICNIPVDRPGRRLYNVRSPQFPDAVSVLLQIDAADGNKVVTVRSPLQIKNHFSVPFAILKFCPDAGGMMNVGVAHPEKESHVPLESYRCQLFLLPVGVLEGQYQQSSTCICWKEKVHQSAVVSSVLRCPSTDAGLLPLVVNTLAAPDELRFISSHGEDDWDPAYVIHLSPAVTVRNLLPYTLRYLLEGSAEYHQLSEGGVSDVLNARVGGEIMELMLIGYQGRSWSGRVKITVDMAEFFPVCLSSDPPEQLSVDISVHVSRASGSLLLSVFSPYWMVNKTLRVLQYRAEDTVVKHPADLRDIILFSFKKKNIFSKNKVQLCVSTSSWSEGFSLDTVGSFGCVKCPDKTMDYLVGVTIQMSSFNLTRLVTLSPFYMLANHSALELEVGEVQDGGHTPCQKWHYIASTECLPLWPELNTGKLCVRVVGSDSSSRSFFFNRQDSGTLLRLEQYGGIIADVNISDHSTVISFTDYYEGAAPALLVNHTTTVTVQFKQSGCSMCCELVPGQVQRFAWDNPAGRRSLNWNCQQFSGELDLVKDECGSFSCDGFTVVHWVCFLDGRQRVLLFTEDVAVVMKARQAEELEQFEQEFTVSLQSLGLSLIHNANKQEIAYVGITSSGVVWEMRPKSRWKSFNRKNISLLEKSFQNQLSAISKGNGAAGDARWVKLESGIEVDFCTMEMRQPYSCPIRRNFLSGIQVEFKQSPHQRSLRAQLHWLQVDNQLPGAIFPIVFNPVHPPKSIALDSEPKPFIDVSIITRHNEHSQVTQLKYFMALVQEMALKIDQDFLAAIINLFTPNTDASSTNKKLIEKDLEVVRAELMEASLTDTSGISFFEHFHISPIKLHLSLSLGSSSEGDGRGLVAVQSVHLLLKSIGATLTDVDDIIFKLACFEVRYQFYRREKLMWAVIRHYSEQFLKQMYVLVLGLDVLGNPFGLIRGLSEGVEAFFYEPFQGAVQGPEEFAEGFVIGVRSLLGHTVGGAAGVVSRITGSVGKGLAAITMDTEFQQKRREEMNRPPRDFGESLAKGGKGLLMGMVGGVTGIVTKPVEGAKKEGAAGFFKGIGKGLVGVVARPTGGIVDMASSTFQGIQRVAESTEEVTKLRPVRLICEDGVIRPYNLQESQGYDLFQRSEIKLLEGEVFRQHFEFHGHRKSSIIVTNRRVLCVKEIDFFGHFSKEWECPYELFYLQPRVEGPDVLLYCRDQNKLKISKKDSPGPVRVVNMKQAAAAEKLCDAVLSAQSAQQQQQMRRQLSQRFLKLPASP